MYQRIQDYSSKLYNYDIIEYRYNLRKHIEVLYIEKIRRMYSGNFVSGLTQTLSAKLAKKSGWLRKAGVEQAGVYLLFGVAGVALYRTGWLFVLCVCIFGAAKPDSAGKLLAACPCHPACGWLQCFFGNRISCENV